MTTLTAKRPEGSLNDIAAYCMFIGYPRSGHSLYGALLNAHPEIVVSHELDALSYIERGIPREQLYELILKKDQWFTQKGSRWYEFNYHVPNQWQGRFRQLRVIGDKKGGRSALRLQKSPQLLSQLRSIVKVPLKIIHVVRNPFDNISTISQRNGQPLESAACQYFGMSETNARLVEGNASEIITIRHEEFIARPKQHLRKLVEFVGSNANEDYLSDCAGIVFGSPSKSRLKTQWSDKQIRSVQSSIEKYDFLQGYSFES